MTVAGRRHRGAATVAGAFAAAALTGLAAAPAAHADAFSDGQWYYTAFHMADNLTAADGSGVTVAVLDGPLFPDAPQLAGAGITPVDTCQQVGGTAPATSTDPVAEHGTEMATMLKGNGTGTVGGQGARGVAPGVDLLYYTVYGTATASSSSGSSVDCQKSDGTSVFDDAVGKAIDDAVARGARVISMSFTGGSDATETAILFGERKGVVFVAATDDQPGTTTSRLSVPAAYNGVVAVNGISADTKLLPYSATGNPDGPLVSVSGPGGDVSLGGIAGGAWDSSITRSGSSPATAWTAGVLAVTASKYPRATGDQLVQTLARNTGGEEHGLDPRALDGYGYGVASLTAMLEHDPTGYPDENPLLRDGARPSTSDILDQEGGSSAPSAGASGGAGSSAGAGNGASSPRPAPAAADRSTGSHTGLWIGLAVGVVVLLALVVLVVVLVRRSGGRRPGPPTGGPGAPPGGWSPGAGPSGGSPPPVPTGYGRP